MNIGNQDDRKIVEDAPRYRSVMIAGPMSAPPMPLSFASARPLNKNARVTAVKLSTHKSSGSAVWKVGNLPSLPAAYFLERSNVYVEGLPQEVANKVSECLRRESIATCCSDDDKVSFDDTCRVIPLQGLHNLTQCMLFTAEPSPGRDK